VFAGGHENTAALRDGTALFSHRADGCSFPLSTSKLLLKKGKKKKVCFCKGKKTGLTAPSWL